MRISLQAELGDFQDRHTIYVFALKMSLLAVTLSSVVILLILPPLDWMGVLPVPLADGVVYGVVLSWLIGGAVSSVLSLVAGHAMHQLSVSRALAKALGRNRVVHENEGLHPGWRRHLPEEAAAARAMSADCDEARLA
ncbi:hypothetical protein SAMN05216228_1007186 [Rhizobium tibeticum]|uniref:Uncharacterized protein n=1 Tax=Rhizobium tibeticum TaxID=501024 RepID=A0A1H8JC07_9HYPH|nr:hypothetical protein [Rhizobium tibeticum]SEH75949.1 hypothetical protein RTCCBAU85039_2191 [Rhizobium tibeticum]SEN78229.1 hypothetical protein SAMN05216228_1007186 [Rhizobium tibeticum]